MFSVVFQFASVVREIVVNLDKLRFRGTRNVRRYQTIHKKWFMLIVNKAQKDQQKKKKWFTNVTNKSKTVDWVMIAAWFTSLHDGTK